VVDASEPGHPLFNIMPVMGGKDDKKI